MEIVSLVLGIVGLVISVFGSVFSWVGAICGVLAIVFGALGMKKESPNKGKAKAGLILGVISLTLGILLTIACIICVGAIALS